MTPEQENIKELVSRYKASLSQGVYPKLYYKNYGHWRGEIEQKIKELENKLKS